jgi:glucosylceramidase
MRAWLATLSVIGLGLGLVSPAGGRPVAKQPRAVPVSVVVTRPDLSLALTRMRPLYFTVGRASRPIPTIRVDVAARYQRVWSFGAAMTDTSAWLIHDELPPSSQHDVMEDLFSTRLGIGLRFLRVPIGASDFTANGKQYTYDDLPPGETDPGLESFSIAHDLPYIIPSLRQALAIDPHIQLLGTPWTAPPWMKANDSFGNGSFSGVLLPSYYGTYAQYFVRFLEAYGAEGVPIDALTVQNEPSLTTFPGGELSASAEGTFIDSYLSRALLSAGLDQVRIYGLDNGAPNLSYAEQLLQGPAAHDLAGIAWHCYHGGVEDMAQLHHLAPRVDEIMSECSPGVIPYSPAEAIIASVRNGATTAALWNIALNRAGGPVRHPNASCDGCTGLVTVSESRHTFELGLGFYELGQLSKYVQPGAVRIASNQFARYFATPAAYGVTAGLDDVAFRNPDGSIVLVAHNNGTRVRFRVAWAGRVLSYGLGPGATATFVWRGGQTDGGHDRALVKKGDGPPRSRVAR